jgi:t-SNARE complex subunit (syntaxin)
MASQQVITALETLHRELEKLEPAIKHIETAQLVTETVKQIPGKHVELMEEIRKRDSRHKDELVKSFNTEAKLLTQENKTVVKATKDLQALVKLEIEELGVLTR